MIKSVMVTKKLIVLTILGILLFFKSTLFPQTELSVEEKLILKQFNKRGKFPKSVFICGKNESGDDVFCDSVEVSANICKYKKVSSEFCQGMRLGEALCFSLDFSHSVCHEVKDNQALCMLGGKDPKTCLYVTFQEALCIALGKSVNTCKAISLRTLRCMERKKKTRFECETEENKVHINVKVNPMRKQKIILKRFYKGKFVSKEDLVKEINIFGKIILYPEKDMTKHICMHVAKDKSQCQNDIALGEALCMSLDNTLSWCRGVSTIEALCLKAGHPKPYCKGVSFEEALCLEIGQTRNYCRGISEEKAMQLLKEKRRKEKKVKNHSI